MASATPQKIFNLPPGGCIRSASGFFCRLPTGAIAFIPSVFRLPWHPDAARIVEREDVVRLLRAETIELVVNIVLLLAGVHYFFSDILTFYTSVLSLPLAVVAHVATVLVAILTVFAVNNASVSWLRIRMVASRPKAPGHFAADALRRWSTSERVWFLSFLNGARAEQLNKFTVLLYILMFLCSGPLLVIVLILLAVSGRAHALDGTVGVMLALYIVVSVWALIESAMVLRQRMLAGRERREAKQTAAQGS